MSFDFSCSANILPHGQFAKRKKKWLHAAVSEIKRTAVKMASAMASTYSLLPGVQEEVFRTMLGGSDQEQLSWGKVKVGKA